MAIKSILHDLDLQGVSQLKNARLHNVTSAELVTLGGTLGASNRGLIAYNTTDNSLYTWNGVSFDRYAVEVLGDIRFAGVINATSSDSVVPDAGAQYVVDTAGTLSTQTGTITYTPSANVEVGDIVLFTSATTASIMERNLEQATETSLGTIRIAAQGEVDAGSVSDEAVTPATLHGYVGPEFVARDLRFVTNETNIAANASAISAESAARIAADSTNSTAIATEEARALAAEAVLQTNIDDEVAARIAGESTNSAALDTEIADRAAADANLLTALNSEVVNRQNDYDNLTTAVNLETARAMTAEEFNYSGIVSEQARATAAEALLATDIAAETTARVAADSAEATTRAANDAVLQSNIDDEVAARTTLGNNLSDAFTAEITIRAANDATLQTNIDSEATARVAGDAAEATARTAADAVLQTNINGEATARVAADAVLQTNIDSEATARIAGDAAGATALATEVTDRAAADTLLQTNIDAANAARQAVADGLGNEITNRIIGDQDLYVYVDVVKDRVTVLENRDNVFVDTQTVNLVADTPFTFVHGLTLTSKDSFTINTMLNGEQVSVQVSSVDVNTLTLTTSVDVTGMVVSVIGF